MLKMTATMVVVSQLTPNTEPGNLRMEDTKYQPTLKVHIVKVAIDTDINQTSKGKHVTELVAPTNIPVVNL